MNEEENPEQESKPDRKKAQNDIGYYWKT